MKERDKPRSPTMVEEADGGYIDCAGLSKVESLARDIFIAELSREEMDNKQARNYSAWAIKVANIFYNEFEADS